MLLKAPPPTDELLSEASAAGTRHRIERQGEVIALFRQSDRILAYRGDESTPFGVLRFGGPHSGAIWMRGDLVGEYDKDLNGEFFVVEVEDGFLAETRRKEDPVAYLIEKAHA